MDEGRIIAVVDIGKTNARVVAVERATLREAAARTMPIESRQTGPYPHLDVARLWDFVRESLATLNRELPLHGISVTTHAAAGAFLGASDPTDDDGLALPILDYEFAGPDELAADYDAVRPPFDETLSPRLPGGLNLGAQIFWLTKRFGDAVGRARAYVNYPQYWAWRLTGVAATEMCSMGCHTDLWDPRRRRWSSLVARLGWEAMFAPLRPAFDHLGPVRPGLAGPLGLPADLPVVCGIHDSNASLLPHLIARAPPFTVASTGTWTVIFAVGGSLDALDPKRDTLANVTAFGEPVPCARFMGGREFEMLAGRNPAPPSEADVDRVVGGGVMALPSFAEGVGPFPDRTGRWSQPPDTLVPGERTAAASLYLALMTAESMACADAAGPTVVEGPFAANAVFCAALAAITGRPVLPSEGASGTSLGAACLFDRERGVPAPAERAAPPLRHPRFPDYVGEWRRLAAA